MLHNNPKVGAGAETLSLSIRILKLTSENEANAFNGTDGGMVIELYVFMHEHRSTRGMLKCVSVWLLGFWKM